MRAFFLAAAVCAAVVLSGCGGDVPRGTVRGTLKFQGKPLTGAPVIFLASDNKTHTVEVKDDGTYTVSGVAYGRVKVSVQSAADRLGVKGQFDAPPNSEAKGVKDEKAGVKSPSAPQLIGKPGPQVPAQYADPEKSGLTFELTQPEQEWSADLK